MRRASTVAAVAATLFLAGTADAGAAIAHRTTLVSVSTVGAPFQRPVLGPVLTADGRATAYATGSGFGGVANVFRQGLEPDAPPRRLISAGIGDEPADGPSGSPAIADDGRTVAFVSSATNLVRGDTNGVADVFARTGEGAIVRVAIGMDGAQPDGPSSEPSVSATGRYVAFTSAATNLVRGDTNGVADVFVRDLSLGRTRRVSVSSRGAQADGASGAPAISASGSAVAFQSVARTLVPGDTNRVADVFVATAAGRTERVSVSSRGRQQDKAITAPFTATPDISGDGRYVVFDSDATTLTRFDTNRRTDVFLHDRRTGTTTLESASSVNVQGDNDSVTPRITTDGRFITFQSFAGNLTADDGPGPDAFVRDVGTRTTALLNATDSGARRAPEPRGQLLQRPSISDDGRLALFLSGARNVVRPARGARRSTAAQLYLRRMARPRIRLVGRPRRGGRDVHVTVAADDPAARRFLCRVDDAVPFACGPEVAVRADAGRRLTIRAGGPGMLWSAPVRLTLGR